MPLSLLACKRAVDGGLSTCARECRRFESAVCPNSFVLRVSRGTPIAQSLPSCTFLARLASRCGWFSAECCSNGRAEVGGSSPPRRAALPACNSRAEYLLDKRAVEVQVLPGGLWSKPKSDAARGCDPRSSRCKSDRSPHGNVDGKDSPRLFVKQTLASRDNRVQVPALPPRRRRPIGSSRPAQTGKWCEFESRRRYCIDPRRRRPTAESLARGAR